MGFFFTRKTTFAALSPMQDFVEAPRDPFSKPQRWLKLPCGQAEASETRERRSFAPRDVVLEVLDLA
ncbi:MAG: hypothetical protein ACAI25_20975 [Planctomycetota bacterium]